MKTLSLLALAAVVATGFTFSAQAGSVTEISDTWKPGFSLDDNGEYSRTRYVDFETGYNPGSKTVVKTEISNTRKQGFSLDDTGEYARQVSVVNPLGALEHSSTEVINTWTKGYFLDDNGSYSKI